MKRKASSAAVSPHRKRSANSMQSMTTGCEGPPSRQKIDVLQAKIAVSLAHAILRDTRHEPCRVPRQLAPLEGLDVVKGLLVEEISDERRHLGEVLVQVPTERGDRTEVGRWPGGPQKTGQALGDHLQ